tara:strand:+ start:1772 stop:2809 length:1038 start_codon:yes stop_codon:yes gene_type:complete
MTSNIEETINNISILPSATTSIAFFITLTIIYGFLMIYNITSSSSLNDVTNNSSNQIYTLIYVLFLLSGSYFINVNISKSICNENSIQWSQVFIITLLPWVIIFALLYFLLELFPGWIKPFSNTIGYIVANSLGATNYLKQILKDAADTSQNPLQLALQNIEKNYSRFINEIDPEESKFRKFIEQLHKEGFIKQDSLAIDNNKNITQLFALIKVKEVIGKLFWYILAGSLISSISYNFIINMTCEKTLDQTQKEISELYDNKNAIKPLNGTKWEKVGSVDENNSTLLDNLIGDDVDLSTFKNKFDGKDIITIIRQDLNASGLGPIEIPKDTYIINNYGDYYKVVK